MALQLCQALGTAPAFPAPAPLVEVAMATGCSLPVGVKPLVKVVTYRAHKRSPFPLQIPLTLPKNHLLVEGTNSPSLIPGPQFWEL